MNLGKDVPAVLALLPERPEKERKKGYFGAQVEGWCLARRAEFTDPVDGWQILVDPQQRARGVPRDSSPGTMAGGGRFFDFESLEDVGAYAFMKMASSRPHARRRAAHARPHDPGRVVRLSRE